MPFIVDYIVDVLVYYTKFKSNGSLNLREYLNEVFIKIIDICMRFAKKIQIAIFDRTTKKE